MKPFILLVQDRTKDLERCVQEASEFFKRYSNMSGSKHVSLEQTSWLGAIVYLGMQEAQRQFKESQGNVVTVVAESKMEPTDHVS